MSRRLRPFRSLSSQPLPTYREGHEILLAGVALISVTLMGTVGFHLIEGWALFDSLYMTVITISTVGYAETYSLSTTGRAFAMILIVMGVGVVMAVFTSTAKFIIERQIRWIFERDTMQETINSLQDHSIICGYGRLSQIVAERLKSAGEAIVIIEKDDAVLERVFADGFLGVQGDASNDEVLVQAGIKRARNILCLLPKDSDNLYIILSSRDLNKGIFILTRAEDAVGEKRLKSAGADRIMAPYRVGGQKIADGLLRPYVTDFIDVAVSDPSIDLQIEEIQIPTESNLCGITLKESGIREKTEVMVAALIQENGNMIFNPSGNTIIEANSTLIGMGSKSNLLALEALIAEGSTKRSC